MASDRLYNILSFTGIPIGGTATLPHLLSLNGAGVQPDFVAPQLMGSFQVVSASTTTVTLRNVSDSVGDCQVWVNSIHPSIRLLGGPPDDGYMPQGMSPRPFSQIGSSGTDIIDGFNVMLFGATGNGIDDDSPAIQAAIDAAASVSASGAFGAIVLFPKGVYLCNTKLIQKDGVWLQGSGVPGTIVKASATFNDTALLTNEHHDGTQEFAGIRDMTFNGAKDDGAICSVAVVDYVSLFVNTSIDNVEVMNGSAIGLRIAAEGTPGGMGPILVQNSWVNHSGTHNIRVEDAAGNSGAADGIVFINVTSEHPGANSSCFYLKGNGHATQWNFYSCHVEMNGLNTGVTGFTLDGVSAVTCRGLQLLTGNAASVTAGVHITAAVQNTRYVFEDITNDNLITNVLIDDKQGVTIAGGTFVTVWVASDRTIRGGQSFTPATASGSKSFIANGSDGTPRFWFDDLGRGTGNSQTSAALDLAANTIDGATTGRVLALINNARTRAFGFFYPDGSFIRFRNFTTAAEAWDVDNVGNMRTWGRTTFGVGPNNDGVVGVGTRAAAPTIGTHIVGEIVFNGDPVAAGFIGWVCITAGTPGVWKSWGVISA